MFPVADTTPFPVQAEETLKTNFFATRDMLTHFLPLIKAGGMWSEHNKGSAWSQSLSIRVCPTEEFQHLQSVSVCSRPCGERVQLRWSPHFEPVQPGPPGTLPQRGHHRGGAGGTDAALCRRSQEGRTQAGRVARDGLRSIKDRTDGNVVCEHPER